MDDTDNVISSIINKNDCKIDCVVDCFTACSKDWSRAKPYTPSKLTGFYNKGDRWASALEDVVLVAETLDDYITIDISDNSSKTYYEDIEYKYEDEIQNKGFKGAEATLAEALVEYEKEKIEDKDTNINNNKNNFLIFSPSITVSHNDKNFAYYVYKNMRTSDIYNEMNGCVYVKLKFIGNLKTLYNKLYNFPSKLFSRMDYKYIYRQQLLIIIDNIFYLMDQNNIEFKFTFFEYDLYKVKNAEDLYIIKIKLKNRLLNNIETGENNCDNSGENSGKNTSDTSDNSGENSLEKKMYSISKTMYIFHSYKKMFYYSVC